MSAGVTPRFECGPKQAARVTPTTITPTAASVEPRGASRTPQQPTYTRRTEKTIVSPAREVGGGGGSEVMEVMEEVEVEVEVMVMAVVAVGAVVVAVAVAAHHRRRAR